MYQDAIESPQSREKNQYLHLNFFELFHKLVFLDENLYQLIICNSQKSGGGGGREGNKKFIKFFRY